MDALESAFDDLRKSISDRCHDMIALLRDLESAADFAARHTEFPDGDPGNMLSESQAAWDVRQCESTVEKYIMAAADYVHHAVHVVQDLN